MEKKQISVKIESSKALTDRIFELILAVGDMAKDAKPGQFVSLYCKEGGRLLPRPISICGIDKEQGTLRLVYRVVGEGTEEFSSYTKGQSITITGPLGNGFFTEDAEENTHSVLFGGGIGIPPMLELAKQLKGKKTIILGYRDADTFLAAEFEKYGEVLLASDDGSVGTKGTVMDAWNAAGKPGDLFFACGPKPMLRGIKAAAAEKGIRAQISMEERMACGIGACLACVCKTTEKDEHSQVKNARICKEGPVFYAEAVEL